MPVHLGGHVLLLVGQVALGFVTMVLWRRLVRCHVVMVVR